MISGARILTEGCGQFEWLWFSASSFYHSSILLANTQRRGHSQAGRSQRHELRSYRSHAYCDTLMQIIWNLFERGPIHLLEFIHLVSLIYLAFWLIKSLYLLLYVARINLKDL